MQPNLLHLLLTVLLGEGVHIQHVWPLLGMCVWTTTSGWSLTWCMRFDNQSTTMIAVYCTRLI